MKIFGFKKMQEKLEKYLCLQLNEYETAPYFIQSSQNLTCDCSLITELQKNWVEKLLYVPDNDKKGGKMYQNTKRFSAVDFELNLTIILGYSNKGSIYVCSLLNRYPHLCRKNENLVISKKVV